ncbi:MAG: aminodeoxychorismate synthase component I [Abditibacteriaceae bacterium]
MATLEFVDRKWRWFMHERTFDKSPFPGCDGNGDAREFFEELRNAIRWGQKYFSGGGAIGFTGYEFARHLEPRAFLPSKNRISDLPEARYTFFRELRRSALREIQPVSFATPNPPPLEEEYSKAIEMILRYIADGDIYQANFVLRFERELKVSPSQLFDRLLQQHPMPFSALLEWDDLAIVSNSPERFLRVCDRQIRAQPIKGTCPRGGNQEEDDALKVLLQHSSKDRAENVMITDLMRNDLGRVCEYGSVAVSQLCQIESFPTLHHLVSVIEGKLRDNLDALDAFGAAFPCGSITGAPKIRAMQIIDELEPVPRGVSMGALGYLDFNGNADWNVAIRTVLCKNGKASFHAGGGIVAGSTATDEWNEMQLKAAAISQELG